MNHGVVYINNGPALAAVLGVNQEQIVAHTNSGRPDLTWTHIDKAGHWHAYDRDGKLPTLRHISRPVPCDGSCGDTCGGEGYHVDVFRCLICDEQIEPGWKAGPHTITMPGLTKWWIDVGPAPADDHVMAWYNRSPDPVSVRFKDVRGGVHFGIAMVTELSMHGTQDSTTVTARAHGTGPLGRRP